MSTTTTRVGRITITRAERDLVFQAVSGESITPGEGFYGDMCASGEPEARSEWAAMYVEQRDTLLRFFPVMDALLPEDQDTYVIDDGDLVLARVIAERDALQKDVLDFEEKWNRENPDDLYDESAVARPFVEAYNALLERFGIESRDETA